MAVHPRHGRRLDRAEGALPGRQDPDNTESQVGTGPYQLAKYTSGQQAVFKANPNYWGPKPKYDDLIINYYSKSSTMKLALQKGEIDMAFRDFTPTELLVARRRQNGIMVHAGNGVVIRYIVFNPSGRRRTTRPCARRSRT